DRNAMSLSQYGVGNGVAWRQDGSGLSDLGISQSNGGHLTVSQSWGVAQGGAPIEVVTGAPK
ncbi:MAG: hypothetical protein JWQ52_987, partial [Phenylobacterium sp.]|nr:hypothetical protein [Phenylobacterium sp.]